MTRPVAEQAAARGVPVPVGRTAGDLRAEGWDVHPVMPDDAVLVVTAPGEPVWGTPTGYAWRYTGDAVVARLLGPDGPAVVAALTPEELGETLSRNPARTGVPPEVPPAALGALVARVVRDHHGDPRAKTILFVEFLRLVAAHHPEARSSVEEWTAIAEGDDHG